MERELGIPCVIYAAKSTEDRRGSIPEQLEECREAIDADRRRRFVAEYEDEAVSAYRRDRGPGLRDATEHAEDLARECGVAELWAQHSDRLARGDSVPDVLSAVVEAVERDQTGMRCSVLMLDEADGGRLYTAAAPSLQLSSIIR